MNFVLNDKSWALKFDNFSHFQNVISNNPCPYPRASLRHYVALCTKIKIRLTPYLFCSMFWSQCHLKKLIICCRPQGRQKLLSAYVSIWTESHKICKAWVLINQILPRCFCSYGLLLSKSNHRGKQVGICESTNINQSISMNRFYPIRALIFIWEFLVFP